MSRLRIFSRSKECLLRRFHSGSLLHLRLSRFLSALGWRFVWQIGLGVLTACSENSGTPNSPASVPLPVGHYEGPITYQGSELRVALELRESASGQVQAELSFPQLPGLEFEAASARYHAPQLRLEQQAGQRQGVTVQAVREGDFLRGILSWDSVQAEFVWARRGAAAPRGFREQKVAGAGALRLLLPDDTLPRHPALLLLATTATADAAAQRAVYCARHGIASAVLTATAAVPDSVAGQQLATTLKLLRRQTAVDSGKVGYWGRGAATRVLALAALQPLRPNFVVLEGAVADTRADAQVYQVFNQYRIPVLGLYASLDTTMRVQESARRLRTALGYRRGTVVRVLPQATAAFIQPGRLRADGQWQWPQPADGYWQGLTQWLQQR